MKAKPGKNTPMRSVKISVKVPEGKRMKRSCITRCPTCGGLLSANDNRCHECGQRIDTKRSIYITF